MIYLGEFKAGETVPYAVAFHNDQGNAEDPATPSAQHRAPNGTWTTLTAPVKQNNSTGVFGGTIDTTGFAGGLHIVEIAGIVSTNKTVKFIVTFRIKPKDEQDILDFVDYKSRVLLRVIQNDVVKM